jgi:hypothetical protein
MSNHPDIDAAAKTIARLRGEDLPDDRTAAALHREGLLCRTDLVRLARAALNGSQRDVAMFVHRLGVRYRGTALGEELRTIDKVAPESFDAVVAEAPDRADEIKLHSAKLLQRYIAGAFPKDEYDQPLTIGAFVDVFDGALGEHAWFGDEDAGRPPVV